MKSKTKLTKKDIIKINARYMAKIEEFEKLTLEELRERFQTTKMSMTDRNALIHVTEIKYNQQIKENAKKFAESNKIEEE